MANTSSAKKAVRVQARKAGYNLKVKNSYKKAVKEFESAVESKKAKKTLSTLLSTAYKQLDKAAKRVISPNKAARIKSRLANKIN